MALQVPNMKLLIKIQGKDALCCQTILRYTLTQSWMKGQAK